MSNTQSLNRYSYVLNNPLSYTDPSGHFSVNPLKLFKSFHNWVNNNSTTIFMVGLVAATGGVASAALAPGQGWIAGAIAGGVGGGTGAAVSGARGMDLFNATLKGAVIGGVSAGLYDHIGSYGPNDYFGSMMTHGVTGGMMSVANGGDFQSGFVAASVTKGLSKSLPGIWNSAVGEGGKVANAMMAATIGGTASKLSGGDFANGAMSAAFSRLFNDDGDGHEDKAEAYLKAKIGKLVSISVSREELIFGASAESKNLSVDIASNGTATVSVGKYSRRFTPSELDQNGISLAGILKVSGSISPDGIVTSNVSLSREIFGMKFEAGVKSIQFDAHSYLNSGHSGISNMYRNMMNGPKRTNDALCDAGAGCF